MFYLWTLGKSSISPLKRILNSIKRYGIPKKLINLMTFNVKIKIERKVGTNTDVGEGVRKGDGVPSVLFNLVLEMVLKELKLKLISCKTKQVHVYPEAKAFCKNN